MKFIKKFENFHDDGIEIDSQTTPAYNTVDRHKAKEYVENIFNSGVGNAVSMLCSEAGIEEPKSKEEIDEAIDKAIQYFVANPERIKSIAPPEHKKFPYMSGDGIARTNNLGGVHHDKYVN